MNGVNNKKTVLCISAMDPLGMSGLHADIRALESMNVHALSCITATTAQNQNGFYQLNAVSNDAFKSQLDALCAQATFEIIKIGLLANLEQVNTLLDHSIIQDKKIILDPVLSATAGDIQGHDDRLKGIKKLLPYCTLVTPNLSEANQLLSLNENNEKVLANALLKKGMQSVLIKGGHGLQQARDYYAQADVMFYLEHGVYDHSFSRGTGCAMASLIAGALALGSSSGDAVTIAKMQMNTAWQQPFSVDDVTGSLQFKPWQAPTEFSPLNLENNQLTVDLPLLYQQPENKQLSFPPCDFPLGLYPIFDRAHWLERILPLGVRIVQLRIKDLEGDDLKAEIALAIKIAQAHQCQLFINDYWQLAIELGAYGVHLGQEDIDDADLAAISKAGIRLGLSSHCFYEVARAKTIQPSYIAFGPVFETQTKDMPWIPQGPQGLSYWRAHLPDTPMVAIGGIHGQRFEDVKATGVDAIAMITAITLDPDPEAATSNYMKVFSQ